MISIELSKSEWYFLYIQLCEIIKNNPNNHIAENIFNNLVDNMPTIVDTKNEYGFKQEYDYTFESKNI